MIRVWDGPEELARGAAELIAATIRQAVAERGRCALLLAGGDTPRRTYELLAGPPYRDTVPWGGLHLFWGDERCVSADDPRSNLAMARLALLDQVPLSPAQVHPVAGQLPPAAAAAAYEDEMRAFFAGGPPRFDLALLGIGSDGHTASLFPGQDAVAERRCWTAVAAGPADGLARVTVTLPVLNGAARVLFLAAGAGKAAVLPWVLAPHGDDEPLPAALVRPESGETVWYLDRDAAGQLPVREGWTP